MRARIGDATSNLQEMRTLAERHYQDKRTYVGMAITATSGTGFFGFDCTSDATSYAITATGSSAMVGFT